MYVGTYRHKVYKINIKIVIKFFKVFLPIIYFFLHLKKFAIQGHFMVGILLHT